MQPNYWWQVSESSGLKKGIGMGAMGLMIQVVILLWFIVPTLLLGWGARVFARRRNRRGIVATAAGALAGLALGGAAVLWIFYPTILHPWPELQLEAEVGRLPDPVILVEDPEATMTVDATAPRLFVPAHATMTVPQRAVVRVRSFGPLGDTEAVEIRVYWPDGQWTSAGIGSLVPGSARAGTRYIVAYRDNYRHRERDLDWDDERFADYVAAHWNDR